MGNHRGPRPQQPSPVEQAETQIEDVVWAPRRGSLEPTAPIVRRGHRKLAGVAGAVVAMTVGLANVIGGGGGQAVVMASAASNDDLHGITSGEPLPTVPPPGPTTPAAPRQVAGPTPLVAPATAPTAPTQVVVPAGAYRGIPNIVLAAYRSAATRMAEEQPSCHLPWALLAGIGHVESNQANNGAVDATGRAVTPIIGPQLNGSGGFALVRDTDHGVLDGDKVYDRAVGPMQFLPSTWQLVGRDGNGDGKADPENVFDASLATATYLCAGGGDLSTRNGLLGAVFRYNRSWQYVSLVLTWAGIYAGSFPVAGPGTTPTATPKPSPTASTPPKQATPAPTATPTPSASAPPSVKPTPTLAPPTPTPTGTAAPTATPTESPAAGPSAVPTVTVTAPVAAG